MSEIKVLVLGVGNLLLGDEGIGVHAVKKLEAEYEFPPAVRLMDGGTLGISLMEYIEDCAYLIVIDAVRGGHAPGSVYRLEDEGLRGSLGLSDSMHQLDLVDTLIMCEMAGGKRPKAVVFGLEPENISALSLELTPAAQAGQEKICSAVLRELQDLGHRAWRKPGNV
jgi:hydrogenase maturation protease